MTIRCAVLVLSIATGTARAAESDPPNESWRVLLPNAQDTVHSSGSTGVWMRYAVRESYPATKATASIVDALSARGWTIRDDPSFERPQPPKSHPLGDQFLLLRQYFQRRYEAIGTHMWLGRWQKQDLHEVVYRLVYSCRFERLGMHSVWVDVCGHRFPPTTEHGSLLQQALNACR